MLTGMVTSAITASVGDITIIIPTTLSTVSSELRS